MIRSSVVGSKGQILIPQEMRDALGILAGTKLLVTREGNRIIAEPVNEEFIRSVRGSTAGGPSMTDALLEERRAEERRRKL
jgi:AbrB family looped-hinge helix DNA binding protein